jgi:hypothetical protein
MCCLDYYECGMHFNHCAQQKFLSKEDGSSDKPLLVTWPPYKDFARGFSSYPIQGWCNVYVNIKLYLCNISFSLVIFSHQFFYGARYVAEWINYSTFGGTSKKGRWDRQVAKMKKSNLIASIICSIMHVLFVKKLMLKYHR